MKITLILATSLALAFGETAPAGDPQPLKPAPKTQNTIPVISAKTQTAYYVPQHAPPYVQYIQKPILIPQGQPQTAMLIIAQPALVPQHMLYAHAAQQLLQYFHSNPQAKMQFLNGYHPHPTAQTYVQAPYQIVQQAYQPSYQQLPTPQIYQQQPTYQSAQIQQSQAQASPTPAGFQQVSPTSGGFHQASPTAAGFHQASPTPAGFHQVPAPSLQQVAQYATVSAQQFSAPMKTAPPIITGFENFTPEQQAQIKEQLSNHFGGSLSPINSNSVQASSQYGAKFGASERDDGGKGDGFAGQSSLYGAKQYAKA